MEQLRTMVSGYQSSFIVIFLVRVKDFIYSTFLSRALLAINLALILAFTAAYAGRFYYQEAFFL